MKRIRIVLAAILVFSIPVAASLYLARHIARSTEFERVEQLARAVLARTATIALQSQEATQRLQGRTFESPCSPEKLALMWAIDLGSSYLQAVGYIQDDRLKCSSLGDHGEGIPLGPARFVSVIGDSIRPQVRLPMVPDTDLLIAERNGTATVVHPELFTDLVQSTDNPWVGVVSLPDRVPLAVRGDFRPAWHERLPPEGGTARFVDGDRIVVLHRSADWKLLAFAAAPVLREEKRMTALAWTLAPLGAVVGLLLWLALLSHMRATRSLPVVMRAALADDEFFLEYQPIVDLDSGRWVSAEALIRWKRPDGTLIRPDLFIPAAEDSGLIQRITERVLELVCAEAPALFARHPQFRLSINLSAADLATGLVVHRLRELTNQPGIEPHNLAVEATERGLLAVDATRRVLADIRALGIRAAIDDFGTGYSGLSYLGTFEVDSLKIDKAFIDTVGTDAPTSDVAVHIIEMAKTLRLDVVAEGIEHPEQAEFLRGRGVRYGQGWLFAKSMPMPALLAALDSAADGSAGGPVTSVE
ncbi:EAL domain-containing protein [Luteimonas yindakuii]|uniref:EAL domain-containing protein n=1 Tax=Luteimonas yindakuii TaxID=2565782 RepID=UPI0014082D79|nr:EAL domain-containing protein [Luteimonas yindakuii]